MLTIQAKNRVSGTTTGHLRKQGVIPAVYYGFNIESTPVSVLLKDFQKAFKEAGESTSVTLQTEKDGSIDALIHEVQLDPVKNVPIHVDFLIIDASKEVTVMVPLEFDGVSEAVKQGLGTLVKVLHEVEIKALPKNLPHSISVDISSLLTADDTIAVSALKAPANVTISTPENEIVASIAVYHEEVEETPVDLGAIEVEKKGKKEEEGALEEEAKA